MKRTVWLWILAVIVTLVSARWQRMTGPTHPLDGRAVLGATAIPYRLERTHVGASAHRVEIPTDDPAVSGVVEWKRNRTADPWTAVPMAREGGALAAELPAQPAAGKLAYRVTLERAGERVTIPAHDVVRIRWRGDVPAWVLVPHIAAMFTAMLLSTRAGLEWFNPRPNWRGYARATLVAVVVGGFVLGPLVLKHAFGMWWTGFPFGSDPTDNKTLAALVVWVVAAIAAWRVRDPRGWVAFAAVATLVVFAIPHSVGGTEFDYEAGRIAPSAAEAPAAPQTTAADSAR